MGSLLDGHDVWYTMILLDLGSDVRSWWSRTHDDCDSNYKWSLSYFWWVPTMSWCKCDYPEFMLAKTTFHHRHLKDLKLTKWVASYVDTLWHDLSVGIGIPLGLNPPWLFDTRPLQASGMNVVWRKVCPEKYLKQLMSKIFSKKLRKKKFEKNPTFWNFEKSKNRNFEISKYSGDFFENIVRSKK